MSNDTNTVTNAQSVATAAASEAPVTAPSAEVEEAMRRKAHEMAEAKRKAEWEEKQKKKRIQEDTVLQKVSAMPDSQASAYAVKRVGADTEKLTRRNMKEMVCEHIQKMCDERPEFARKVLHPRKSMIRCFKYINRQARAYAEQEMKDNGMERTGVYGCDVPDGLCYQWAVDYFNDPNAQEDREGEEKFVAKPYTPKTSARARNKAQPEKQPEKQANSMDQLSILEVC